MNNRLGYFEGLRNGMPIYTTLLYNYFLYQSIGAIKFSECGKLSYTPKFNLYIVKYA